MGVVKSFGEPHSIESSYVGGGSCALCYSRHDSVPSIIAGNFLGMADGPTWRPKPTGRHWLPCPALELVTWHTVFWCNVLIPLLVVV